MVNLSLRQFTSGRMKIAYVTAGAGGTICGNCLKDNALARALLALGHDVQLIPTYTPIRTDEPDVSLNRVFLGGVNVYLNVYARPRFRFVGAAPRWLGRLWDRPGLLRWVSKFAVKTRPDELGALTVSVLEGPEGPQAGEIQHLIDWLAATSPDVVHLTNSMLAGIAPAAKRKIEAPVFCSLQGEDYFMENLPSPHRERAFELLKKQAEAVDVFLSPSHDHARAMAPHLGVPEEKIAVVHPGIDLQGFEERKARNPGEFVVGYLARVSREKGLHLLVEAVRLLRLNQEFSDRRIRLRVAGWLGADQRNYFAEIEGRVRESGLQDDFEFLGTVDREEKIRFLRTLDVLSVPVTYRAPKGLYVLEALAAGVPVVQPRLGVFPELLEATGGGLLCEPNSPAGLAEALGELMRNPDQAQEMAQKGRRKVYEHFHSRRMAEETVAVYQARPESAGAPLALRGRERSPLLDSK
jgi:glycosyltransferase involved in cell wall biosynthesis